jgi:hypothetical protein
MLGLTYTWSNGLLKLEFIPKTRVGKFLVRLPIKAPPPFGLAYLWEEAIDCDSFKISAGVYPAIPEADYPS